MKEFTPQEIDELKTVANQSWQVTSQDLPFASYSPAEVFEIAVDAQRMRSHCQSLVAVKLVDKFYELDWKEMEKFIPIFFPAKSYE